MSKIGYVGSTFRIIWDGNILAAVRTKSVQHIRAAIDVSHEERDGWRHLDPKYESVGVEISVEGVATPTNYALLEQWLGDTFTELAIGFPDGTIEIAEDGAFLRNLTYSGEHAGFVSFAAAFVFSGEVHVLQELVLTSRPYPLEVLDALDVGGVPLPGGRYEPTMVEALYV
ncbi:MAG: phage tail protein, partial [Gammaproteobacteria bacterium]